MWVLALVVLVLLLGSPAEHPAATYERPRLGLAVEVPYGWKIVRRQLSACTDPAQRIALARGDALVQIVEQLTGDVGGFPSRPRRFELRGSPEQLGCCPPLRGRGWFIPFRDGARGFYAYVYAGAAERAQALRILDSLVVRPRVGSRGVADQALAAGKTSPLSPRISARASSARPR
jgi:hypothetical protein